MAKTTPEKPKLSKPRVRMAPIRQELSKEERVKRVAAARQAYSKISRATKASSRVAAKKAETSALLSQKNEEPAKVREEPEFVPDPAALKLIKSDVPITRAALNLGKSISARPSIIGRPSVVGRRLPDRPPRSSFARASMAGPRPSVLPLGINLFEANDADRLRAREFIVSNLAPGRKTSTTEEQASTSLTVGNPLTPSRATGGLFSGLASSRRKKTIRFQDSVIMEQRESVDIEELGDVKALHLKFCNELERESLGLASREATPKRFKSATEPEIVPRSILSKKGNSKQNLVFPEDENLPPAGDQKAALQFEDVFSYVMAMKADEGNAEKIEAMAFHLNSLSNKSQSALNETMTSDDDELPPMRAEKKRKSQVQMKKQERRRSLRTRMKAEDRFSRSLFQP
ncbi:unnamed protein product [Caenorhabditis auriculariae]|uniref:Uncharacterized protein n=1 Tax=Caenorhabditis auriculariae TaxID=2777116 RepID=A0A8S1HI67_9PELO|nr:unnamed protein product [Caenorhabditis auriculariae]